MDMHWHNWRNAIAYTIIILSFSVLTIAQLFHSTPVKFGNIVAVTESYELADTASGAALNNVDTTCFARMDSLRAVTLIVVGVHDYPTTPQTGRALTDNYGNTYVVGVTASNATRNGRVTMFYCANPSITADTIRITYRSVNQSSSYPDMAVQAWRGVTSPVLDATSSNFIVGGTQTVTPTGTLTPTVATAMGGSMWGGSVVPANTSLQPTASGSLTTSNQQMWWTYIANRRFECAMYYKTNIGTSAFTTTHTHTTFTGNPSTYAVAWAFR